jgi:hypothetical protein
MNCTGQMFYFEEQKVVHLAMSSSFFSEPCCVCVAHLWRLIPPGAPETMPVCKMLLGTYKASFPDIS